MMNTKNIDTYTGIRCIFLSIVVLLLDLFSKKWVNTYFCVGKSVPVGRYINFTYAQNFGAAFGLLANEEGWQRWLFVGIGVSMIILLLIGIYRSDAQNRLSNIGYSMIIGGTAGNVYDRIVHGMVIDFIDVYIANWHWPTFNIADTSICIGTSFVCLDVVLCKRE